MMAALVHIIVNLLIRIIISVDFRYNFNKFAQYKQLTLEEAEDKLAKRGKTKDGYPRWMMKVANKVEKLDDSESASGVGRGHKRITGRDDEGNDSDKGDGDDDEEGPRGGDFDFDYDDIEKGDKSSF